MSSSNNVVHEDLAQAVYEKVMIDMSKLRVCIFNKRMKYFIFFGYHSHILVVAKSVVYKFQVKELTRAIVFYSEFLSPKRDLKKLAESVLAEFQDESKSEWFKRKMFIQGGALHRLLLSGVSPYDFLDEYFSKVNKGKPLNVFVSAPNPC